MKSKLILPILSALGILLGIVAVFISRKTPPTPQIPFPPPVPPFEYFVAGEGLVEAASEDISIGTPFTEIVEKVWVEAGNHVKKGDPLFTLNTQQIEKQLATSKAALAVVEAEYQKQLSLPRPEDVPPYRARVKEAESQFLDKWEQYQLISKIDNPRAVSLDEKNQRKFAALAAKSVLEEMQEELNLLLAGAWIQDLEITRAQIQKAKAEVEELETEISRSTIRAPMEGTVFRVNIRPGELADSSELTESLLLFGSMNPLHIRVDIDEEDAWRVIPGAPGIAYVRGNSNLNVPLTYVRLEPYLIPKQSLTGVTKELVDTRVLQIIYQFDRKNLPIYPGMLMDVFLESQSFESAREIQ